MNNDINEQYIGFETTKLLKEKGFQGRSTHYYILDYSSFKADKILKQHYIPR